MKLVGITGHQDIPPSILKQVRARLKNELSKIEGPILGVSSLAAGADQLFASAVVDGGYSLRVIVPCDDYESTFSNSYDRNTYKQLLESAEEAEILSHAEPTEEAFLEAGHQLVEVSDLVFAVWDGKPSEGKGGTADIVRYAKDHQKKVVRIWPEGVDR